MGDYLASSGLPGDIGILQAKQQNPEIEAILNVGGEISLYVTQTDNNDFYLDHDAFQNPSESGAAFFDCRCRLFPEMGQVIIHGHNMKSGAIFGALQKFRTLSYFRQHPLIFVTTLKGTEIYAPYAIADVDVDADSPSFFLEVVWRFTPEMFQGYVDYLRGMSIYSIPVDLRFGDKLLMLSTCSYVYGQSRMVICARRLREGESPAGLSSLIARSMEKSVGENHGFNAWAFREESLLQTLHLKQMTLETETEQETEPGKVIEAGENSEEKKEQDGRSGSPMAGTEWQEKEDLSVISLSREETEPLEAIGNAFGERGLTKVMRDADSDSGAD
jgi:SrtB family sortase